MEVLAIHEVVFKDTSTAKVYPVSLGIAKITPRKLEETFLVFIKEVATAIAFTNLLEEPIFGNFLEKVLANGKNEGMGNSFLEDPKVVIENQIVGTKMGIVEKTNFD